MAVTQKDIADHVGVSRRLVGYALNNEYGVSEEMRQKIVAAAAELGYKPNRAARALVTGKTFQIALCLPTLSEPYHAQFIYHFEKLSRESEYDLIVMSLENTASFSNVSVDGAIVHDSEYVGKLDIPAVFLQSPPLYAQATPGPFDQIFMDINDAAVAAMEHLVNLQRQRIAYVSYETLVVPTDPRYAAYLEAVSENDHLQPEIITFQFSKSDSLRNAAHQALQKYFLTNGIPDALLCCNDEVAIGAYRALKECRRNVPTQTAVIGCDDIPETRDLNPTLSTISNNWPEVCREAWNMLTTRIANPDLPPREIYSKGKFVKRESSSLENS